MKKKSIFSLLFIIYSIISYAGPTRNFHVLDVKSGISDNYIQGILCDSYGFMWFATTNGLNRYDGYHFRQYTTKQLGQYNNSVKGIRQDASGKIWIDTHFGYCIYNKEKDELSENISNILIDLGITEKPNSLYIDEDGNLWTSNKQNVYYYRYDTKQLHSFQIPAQTELLYVSCRDANAYLLLSNGNIVSADTKSNTIKKETIVNLKEGFQPRIYVDSQYNIWFFITHGQSMKCYSTSKKKWLPLHEQKDFINENNNITSITDDRKGNIWIGTDNNGIFIYNIENRSINQIYKEAYRPFTLPSNHITCFFKDDKDIMWIGTGKQGVTYTDLNAMTFENIYTPKQEDVSSLLEDQEGNLWLGFDGEGIAHLNTKQNKYTYYNTQNHSIPSNLIVCSFLDSNNKIWWGSFGGGVFFHQDGKFIQLKDMLSDKKNIILSQYIRKIIEDHEGNIWIGSYDHGIYCLDKYGEIQNYSLENSTLKTNYIADIAYDNITNVYVATNSGIYKINIENKKIQQLSKDKSGKTIIHDHYANCIFHDNRGLLWIGGRKGISIYDTKEDTLTQIDQYNGLSNPYIRAIAEDKHGNMWITTDNGITHISIYKDKEDNTFKFNCMPFFEEDGIGDFTFNNLAIFCNPHNEILFGGSKGFIKAQVSQPLTNKNSHNVIFTELYISNERIEAGKATHDGRILLNKNIQLVDEITMDYSDSNFSIEVSAMDYTNRHKIQYIYRLGEKEQWIKLDGNRIYFNKLSPGTHHLEVKVNEKDNTQNIASLTIHVHPPFWLSTFAYITYGIIFITFILFVIIRLKKKHALNMLQQQHEMEIIKQHEMDESKMRFFTNVSHDLRTPLSLIITPLEKLLSLELSSDIREHLNLIYRNAQILLDEVNQLLDFRKLDQEKAQLSPSYGNIIDSIQQSCSYFSSLFQEKKIKLTLTLNSSPIEMNYDPNKLQRIMLNLLSNAIKYNVPNGSVSVTVDKILTTEGEQARIQISDTGIGIKDENKSKIFDRFFQEKHHTTSYVGSGIGLHIVKEYVALHGGTIKVEDNIPQGSIFIINLPITGQIQIFNNQDNSTMTETQQQEYIIEKQDESPKPSILIVEDNDDFRHFLINCLKSKYIVFEASNGKKALSILSQEFIQIVITDLMMPIMDGTELCRKIKNDVRYSHIPVIMLTARSAEEHILSGLKEGADDYITKPFNLEIFLLRIQRILERTQYNHEKFKSVDISPADITITSLDENLIEKAIKTVEENMDNSDFSVEDLSAAVNMSRGHLYKKLISITGKSPLEFIRILRIKRGRQLLEESQLSISQISYQVGLSPKQFSKYFKDEYGFLPSEFKKNTSSI